MFDKILVAIVLFFVGRSLWAQELLYRPEYRPSKASANASLPPLMEQLGLGFLAPKGPSSTKRSSLAAQHPDPRAAFMLQLMQEGARASGAPANAGPTREQALAKKMGPTPKKSRALTPKREQQREQLRQAPEHQRSHQQQALKAAQQAQKALTKLPKTLRSLKNQAQKTIKKVQKKLVRWQHKENRPLNRPRYRSYASELDSFDQELQASEEFMDNQKPL